ncbi:unnamed protein product [Calypogeia fissa]
MHRASPSGSASLRQAREGQDGQGTAMRPRDSPSRGHWGLATGAGGKALACLPVIMEHPPVGSPSPLVVTCGHQSPVASVAYRQPDLAGKGKGRECCMSSVRDGMEGFGVDMFGRSLEGIHRSPVGDV